MLSFSFSPHCPELKQEKRSRGEQRRAREVAGVETWCGERRGGEKARVDLYRGSWAQPGLVVPPVCLCLSLSLYLCRISFAESVGSILI
jgi:hypothetical protein